ARVARTQRENPDEKATDAEPDPIRSQREAADDALDDVDPAAATHVAASATVTVTEPDVREPELTERELTESESSESASQSEPPESEHPESDAVVDHDATAEPGTIRRFAAAARHRIMPLRRPTKRGIAVTVMSVITIAALVTTGLIGWHHHTTTSEHERADAFTAAADRGVAAITSLDFNNAQRDVQRI
ncbi:hypothetical protein G3I15_40365, partial [Streptomyces sp. SID10244]|nr:hypothetical protein [Streptomyces sp. SID10244]